MTEFFIHETALIDDGAVVGAGTKIWHFCHIMKGARIGKNCIIGQNVFVGAGVSIGNRVKVQNNVSVYTGVELEDDVFVGPSAVFTNVINPRSFIERKDAFKVTRIAKGASIGANATILCGITVGAFALVGAAAVVTRSVPDFALVTGNPAKRKGWIGVDGNALAFDTVTGLATDINGLVYRLENDHVALVSESDQALPYGLT